MSWTQLQGGAFQGVHVPPGKRSIWKAAGARFVIPLKPGNAVIHPLIKLAGRRTQLTAESSGALRGSLDQIPMKPAQPFVQLLFSGLGLAAFMDGTGN